MTPTVVGERSRARPAMRDGLKASPRSGAAAIKDASERGRQGAHVVEMQRRRLLVACTEVLAQHGWGETSVGRICARAGVSRRTFYDVFDDREACFVAAFDELVGSMAAALVPIAGSAASWRVRVRATVTRLLELLESEPATARVCLIESWKAGATLLERRRRALAALAAFVDEGRTETRSGPDLAALTAESVVGGALAIVQARFLEEDRPALLELVNPLMSMIVTPYLGAAAARRELRSPAPTGRRPRSEGTSSELGEPFRDLPIRITFRTARVLGAVATLPDSNNRAIGTIAGVEDQGQISKLLKRLQAHGLIENCGEGHARGEPNAWRLTTRGAAIQRTLNAPS